MATSLGFISFFIFCFAQTNHFVPSEKELHSLQYWMISTDSVHWQPYQWNKHDADLKGIRFFKTTISLHKNTEIHNQLGLWFMGTFTAYNLYWDGEILGTNGVVSNTENLERSGSFTSIFHIPNQKSTQGNHELFITLSNFSHTQTLSLMSTYLGKLSTIREIEGRESFRLGFLSGLYLLAAFLCLILYQSGGNFKPYLTFSFVCLGNLILSFRELLLYHYSVNNGSVFILNLIYQITYPSLFILLYYFITDIFQLKKYLLPFAIFVYSIYFFYEDFTFYVSLVSYMFITSYAYFKGNKRALIILLGMSLYLLISLLTFIETVEHEYSFGVVTLVLSVFYLIGASAREIQLENESSRLKSERLENELLKKSIQPHFINNTLLSIIHWIRKTPDVAVDMVHALSEEFDLMMSFSKQKQIPIEDEIKLCEHHLFIMSHRREQGFRLLVENLAGNVRIPPLVLHTLIENSMSHLPADQESLELSLRIQQTGNELCITLITPTTTHVRSVQKDGVGYRYIKSRLTESYGNRWLFTHEHREQNWRETIRVNL